MAGLRMDRVDEELKRAISEVIRNDVKDDRVSDMTSVVRVEATSDLKYAKVYISVYGEEKKRKATIDGLNHASPYIRRRLSKTMDIRRMPELTFILDNSIEYSIQMSKLIDDAIKKESK